MAVTVHMSAVPDVPAVPVLYGFTLSFFAYEILNYCFFLFLGIGDVGRFPEEDVLMHRSSVLLVVTIPNSDISEKSF